MRQSKIPKAIMQHSAKSRFSMTAKLKIVKNDINAKMDLINMFFVILWFSFSKILINLHTVIDRMNIASKVESGIKL